METTISRYDLAVCEMLHADTGWEFAADGTGTYNSDGTKRQVLPASEFRGWARDHYAEKGEDIDGEDLKSLTEESCWHLVQYDQDDSGTFTELVAVIDPETGAIY